MCTTIYVLRKNSESYYFYRCVKLLYIAYAWFCNVLINKHPFIGGKNIFKRRGNGKRETPELKIFHLYSETSLCRCTFDLDICFSHSLELLEQEISYYLDCKKK